MAEIRSDEENAVVTELSNEILAKGGPMLGVMIMGNGNGWCWPSNKDPVTFDMSYNRGFHPNPHPPVSCIKFSDNGTWILSNCNKMRILCQSSCIKGKMMTTEKVLETFRPSDENPSRH